MVFQQVGIEVFHYLVYFVCLFFNDGVIDFGSLHSCAHEGDGMFVIYLVLLIEYYNKKFVGGEGA